MPFSLKMDDPRLVKNMVFSRGDSLAAFFSENAAIYNKEEVDD